MNTCKVEGCDKKSRALDLCMMHYIRHRRHGTFDSVRPYDYQGYKKVKCVNSDCQIMLTNRYRKRKTGLCKKHYYERNKEKIYIVELSK